MAYMKYIPFCILMTTTLIMAGSQPMIAAGEARYVGPVTNGNEILQLEPVIYDPVGPDNIEYCLVAQQVAKIDPNLVSYDEAGNIIGIRYDRPLVVLMVAKIQDLERRLRLLESERMIQRKIWMGER